MLHSDNLLEFALSLDTTQGGMQLNSKDERKQKLHKSTQSLLLNGPRMIHVGINSLVVQICHRELLHPLDEFVHIE